MKHYPKLLLLLTVAVSSAQGQIADDFAKTYFLNINDFHVKSISKTFTQDKPGLVIEVEFRANKEKYSWHLIKKDFNGKQLEARKFVYDGKDSFSLLPDKRLVVFPGHQREQSSIYYENAIFLPFMLGAIEDRSKSPASYFTPTLSEFLEFKVKILKQTVDPATRRKVVEFTGKREPLLGLECPDDTSNVSVRFDSSAIFPASWEKSCVDRENKKRSYVWKATELAEILVKTGSKQMLPYAKKSIRRVILDDYEYVRIENEIVSVSINTDMNEDFFYIDPTEALLIEDVANQKLIEIPN